MLWKSAEREDRSRFLARIGLLLISLATVVVPPAASIAQTNAARNWSDVGARFKTSAEFVRRLGSRVVLRGADGKEMEVSYARLSADDRAFVDAQTNKPPKAPPSPSAADAHIVVTLSDKGRSFDVYTGTVFAEADGYRYVAAGPVGADSIVQYFNEATGAAHAVVESGGEARRVALEKVGFSRHNKLALLRAPLKELPAPFVPPSLPPKFTRGDVVWFVGHEIRAEKEGPLVLPNAVEAVVRESYVNLQGEQRGFLAETVAPVKTPRGVFVGPDGAALALARAVVTRPDVMNNIDPRFGRQTVIFDAFSAESTEQIRELLAPEVLFVWSKLRYLAGSVEVVLQVQLVDVTAGAKPLKLKLLGVEDDNLSNRPDRFHFSDGRWIDKPASDAWEIELQKMSQLDPEIEYSLKLADWPQAQIMTGKFSISTDTKMRHLSYQCVYVEPDGKLRPLGTPGQIFYRVSSDELNKRR